MINFCFIYFKNDQSELLQAENIDINNIIYKYSYPSCMNIHNSIQLSPEEKLQIINNEYEFIKGMIETKYPTIKVLRIPRIIYDLFNYNKPGLEKKYYTLINTDFRDLPPEIAQQKEEEEDIFNIKNRSNRFAFINLRETYYNDYCTKIKTLYENLSEFIIELNKFIIENIDLALVESNDPEYYQKLLEELFNKKLKDINISIAGTGHWPQLEYLRPILDFELNKESKYPVDNILIYRTVDSTNDRDDVVNLMKSGDELHTVAAGAAGAVWSKSFSLSFNTSVLNGLNNDTGSCTYCLRLLPNNKYKIIPLKKHFYEDKTDRSFQLFFIPPIHPFFQMYFIGEAWHVRTKLDNETSIGNVVWGKHTSTSTDKYASDYLISNVPLGELKQLYTDFSRNQKIYNKYLKYKNKYLKLKYSMKKL
jgi:hypothetical protein